MEFYTFLLPLALLLIVSKVLMKICERFNIPTVIGMLLAGILVGLINYIPGQDILNDASLTGIGFIAKIGVILIMFSAGLETDLKSIKSVGVPVIFITLAGVIVPMALGFVVVTLFHGGFAALDSRLIAINLFYGVILTATSVSVSVATLKEFGKLNTKVGTTIVAAAILDDILGIVVLSIVLALNGDASGAAASPAIVIIKTVLYFIVVAMVAFVAKKFFAWLNKKYDHHRLVPIISLGFCFIMSYLSERVFGIADITGAYIVGLMLSSNPGNEYINRKSDILSYMIFVPIFFGNVGISIRFSEMNMDMMLFGVLFVIVGMVGKIVGCGGASLLCRYNMSDSLKVGIGMMSRAEVALICAQKGVEYGLIDNSIMPFILILIVVTSFATPIFLGKIYNYDAKKAELQAVSK